MKTRILSLAILFIALFSFNNAFAQGKPANNISGKPHFVGTVCYDTEAEVIYGKIAGIGSNISNVTVVVTGEYGCRNRGGQMPKPWSSFTLNSGPLTEDTQNPGTYLFSVDVSSLEKECHDNNWTTVYRRLVATLNVGTKKETTSNVSLNCN